MDVSANTSAPGARPADRLVSSMNAMHMCFAVGALATPLVVALTDGTTGGLGLAAIVSASRSSRSALCSGGETAPTARGGAAQPPRGAGPTPAAWRLAIVAPFFLLYVGSRCASRAGSPPMRDELGLGAAWPTALTATFWGGFLAGRLLMTWRGDRIATGTAAPRQRARGDVDRGLPRARRRHAGPPAARLGRCSAWPSRRSSRRCSPTCTASSRSLGR